MKIPASLKSMRPVEIVLFVAFMIYIVFPIGTPETLAPYVDSALGMVLLFAVTVAMFVYTNPLLGVLFIFVAYEVLRRSSGSAGNSRAIIMKYTPTQVAKDEDLRKMNPVVEKTVEEEVIEVRAPIGKSEPTEYIVTSFKPVAEKLEGASVV
uniref:Uncharacterized protein n=1 Tax=viral metagenome TaxID=1070528 RepID=A0A6C0KGY7_9ZZZZ